MVMDQPEEDADEAIPAIDDPECLAFSGTGMPAEIADCFSEYGRKVQKFQFSAAKLKVTNGMTSRWRASTANAIWLTVLDNLANIAMADLVYCQLTWLLPRSLFKKEADIIKIYNTIVESLKRSIDGLAEGSVASHICEQCISYCNARMELCSCYFALLEWASKDASCGLELIEEKVGELLLVPSQFHHPLLSGLHHNFIEEVEILRMEMGLHRAIANLDLMESILRLKELREKLAFWVRDIEFNFEQKRGFFESRSSSNKCNIKLIWFLLNWMYGMMSKLTLLFQDSLVPFCEEETAKKTISDIENGMDSMEIFDTVTKLNRKEPQAVLMLIVDRVDQNEPFFGFRYHRAASRIASGRLSGLDEKFPRLYATDTEFFVRYHEVIARFIEEVLRVNRKGFYVEEHDKKHLCLYGEHVERRTYCVIGILSKKPDRDAVLGSFCDRMSHCLRGASLVLRLKEKKF